MIDNTLYNAVISPAIILTGSERIDYINRISTQNIKVSEINIASRTLFLNEKGKIVDFPVIIILDDRIILFTTLENSSILYEHLNKFIVYDDVILSEPNYDNYKLTFLLNLDVIFEALEINVTNNYQFEIIKNGYLFYNKYKIPKLNIFTNETGYHELENLLRIFLSTDKNKYYYYIFNHGIAETSNEININFNPLECGLRDFISFNKGCYIGQEIISRIDSQGKIPKIMVSIRAERLISTGETILTKTNSGLMTKCGIVTSFAEYHNNFSGLGFINSQQLDFNAEYFTLNKKIKLKIFKII